MTLRYQIEQPTIRPISFREFALYIPYVYQWESEGNKYRITVPKGFIFDGSSVPRTFWSFIQRVDGLGAACLHDYLLGNAGLLPQSDFEIQKPDGVWQNHSLQWTRRSIDRLFGRVLRESGVRQWKRRSMVGGVRINSIARKRDKLERSEIRFYDFGN